MTSNGSTFDRNVVENSDRTDRQYIGLTTQATYDFGAQMSVGGNYTLSHAQGSLEGETAAGDRAARWRTTIRNTAWRRGTIPKAISRSISGIARGCGPPTTCRCQPTAGTITLGLLQQFASGVPYPAMAIVPTAGTAQSRLPDASAGRSNISFSAAIRFARKPRIARIWPSTTAIDSGIRRGFRPELFFHGELLNVFNQFQACGCGENVFRNGGITDLTSIQQGVQLDRAVQSVHDARRSKGVQLAAGDQLRPAAESFGYTSPRIFRFSVGVRF